MAGVEPTTSASRLDARLGKAVRPIYRPSAAAARVPTPSDSPSLVPDLPVVQLSQRFIEDNAGGGGEVEAADGAGRHRDVQHALAETG